MEALRGRQQREVVVQKVLRIYYAICARVGPRRQVAQQLAPHIQEAAAGWPEQPLLRAAGQEIDVGGLHIERQRAKRLDAVDYEIDVALAAKLSYCRQVVAEASREDHSAHRDDAGAAVHARLEQVEVK